MRERTKRDVQFYCGANSEEKHGGSEGQKNKGTKKRQKDKNADKEDKKESRGVKEAQKLVNENVTRKTEE